MAYRWRHMNVRRSIQTAQLEGVTDISQREPQFKSSRDDVQRANVIMFDIIVC